VWFVGLAATGLPVVLRTIRGMFAGKFAADVVALLAIITAAVLMQPVVGLVVVLMQTGGEALEEYAEGRASRAIRELEEMAPRRAHRVTAAGIADIAVDEIVVGDTLLLRPGELVPCDSVVTDGRSHVDTSRITGESVPLSATIGTRLVSGCINGEGALTLRASALARESQYSRIVELVRSAQASKAPLQRIADRYAVWFTPLTILACAATFLATGEATRVLAILAVATPCPLIIATPVAIIGGLNRAARRQIIVRHGAALEHVGQTTTAVFDKTGTITLGQPRIRKVYTDARWSEEELLALAAGIEQGSSHLLARTLVEHATSRGISLPAAQHIVEEPGRGVRGTVNGHEVLVGARGFIIERYPRTEGDFRRLVADEQDTGVRLLALVAVDGGLAGVVEYADQIKSGAAELFAQLAGLGFRRTLLLSGDHAENVASVAARLGITDVEGDLLPGDKVSRIQALMHSGERVLMVGDGVNDAPALSTATVGIALASHGGGVTAESADIVLLSEDVTRVAEAVRIGRRTMRIARQGIWIGLGLSGVGMLGAAFGLISPVAGALIQEGVDLTVILNALRSSVPGWSATDDSRSDTPLIPAAAPHDSGLPASSSAAS
jgi:heavy metal translocating P-type ATPase